LSGRYFEAGKKESLKQIYANIEEDLRSQCNLGYTDGQYTSGSRSAVPILRAFAVDFESLPQRRFEHTSFAMPRNQSGG
jgi:hypothetical protein